MGWATIFTKQAHQVFYEYFNQIYQVLFDKLENYQLIKALKLYIFQDKLNMDNIKTYLYQSLFG